MFRLIYQSQARTNLPVEEIAKIVAQSRSRNEADGITGLLLYHKRQFFQVLEGDEAKVRACYARVLRDPRHHRLDVLSTRRANTRAFTTWFMGCENVRDLPMTVRKSALSIIEIERRLADVNAMDEVVEGKKALVRRLGTFLHA